MTSFLATDELADLAIHSESDSVRDELSSGMRSVCGGGNMSGNKEVIPVLPIRSEAEEDDSGRVRPVASARKPVLGSTPAHLSLSTTSSLSSTSTNPAARLVQSSLRDGVAPPQPPPRR